MAQSGRHSIRLKDFDYSQVGAYFVTICTYDRQCLFGQIVDGKMQLNEFGRLVAEEWSRSGKIRHEMDMDEFIVMPNHVHGIIKIIGSEMDAGNQRHVGATGPVAPTYGTCTQFDWGVCSRLQIYCYKKDQ